MFLIELFILYFIYRDAGKKAREKGYSPLRWRIHAFMVWFFGEMLGILIMMSYFPEAFANLNANPFLQSNIDVKSLLLVTAMGLSTAYLFYLLLKKYWESLPYNPEDYD